jgi:hypothetical protein
MPRPVPTKSFPINHSYTIPAFENVDTDIVEKYTAECDGIESLQITDSWYALHICITSYSSAGWPVYLSRRYANLECATVETVMSFLLKRDSLKKNSVAVLELDEEYVLAAISMLHQCKFVLQVVT